MVNWTKVGTNVVIGGGAGAVDQLVQNQDEKRRRTEEAAGRTFSMWKEYGTYLNYGIPILAVVGMATNMLRGDMADKAILVGSQLAGRKAVYTATKAAQSAPWRPAPRKPAPQTQKEGLEKVGIV